jgi:hypothetical protein
LEALKMTIAERIYALVRGLPEDRAAEILTFVEFVKARTVLAGQAIAPAHSMGWSDLVVSLSGGWGEEFPTLEELRSIELQNADRSAA